MTCPSAHDRLYGSIHVILQGVGQRLGLWVGAHRPPRCAGMSIAIFTPEQSMVRPDRMLCVPSYRATPVRKVDLPRATITPSATALASAKHSVLPVLTKGGSKVSHCPSFAMPRYSTPSETVTTLVECCLSASSVLLQASPMTLSSSPATSPPCTKS